MHGPWGLILQVKWYQGVYAETPCNNHLKEIYCDILFFVYLLTLFLCAATILFNKYHKYLHPSLVKINLVFWGFFDFYVFESLVVQV